MHSLKSSLPDSWHKKEYATALHHGLQGKLHFGSLLAFLKFIESVNCSYFLTLYKESFRDFFMQSLALLRIYLYLSHIQHYYLKQHDYCNNKNSHNACLQ